jgi:prepilin-type N-terminal cleavage/methylation domain-containing protein
MRKQSAFTLIELVTAMAVILVLTGLVLSIASYATQKSNKIRTQGEIKMLETACETYKADYGSHPQDADTSGSGGAGGGASGESTSKTDMLSPKEHFVPTEEVYAEAGEFLYKQLSGDKKGSGDDPDGIPDSDEKVYVKELDPRILKIDRDKNDRNKILKVHYFQDPWGNPYGYSTAALHDEQEFQADLRKGKKDAARKSGEDLSGFNADSFDLWSTAGSKPRKNPSNPKDKELEWAKWIKNW